MIPMGRHQNSCGCRMAARTKMEAVAVKEMEPGVNQPSVKMWMTMPTRMTTIRRE